MAGGGSSQPTQTTSTVNQSNLPDYAKPYYQDLMSRAQGVANQGYQSYNGQRIANFSQPTQQYFQGVQNIGQTYQPQLGAGLGLQGVAAQGFGNAGQTWNTGIAQQYMNPFTDMVSNRLFQQAQRQYGIQQQDRNAAAVRAGNFGGYRQAVEDAQAQEGMNRNLLDQQANLLKSGYDTAYSNFNSDMARQMQSAQGIAGVGQNIFNMGAQQRDLTARDLDLMKGIGAQQEQKNQQSLDLGYNDFVNQRDWNRNQLGWYSGIMHGVPVSANSDTTTFQSQSPINQLAGLGIGAYGLTQAAKGIA